MGSTTSKSESSKFELCEAGSSKFESRNFDPYLCASRDTDLSEFRSEMGKRTQQPGTRWYFYDLVKDNQVAAIRYLSKIEGPELMKQCCWQSKHELMDVLLENNHILPDELLDISHALGDETMVRKLLDHGCMTEIYSRRNPKLKKLIWEVCHPKNLFLVDILPSENTYSNNVCSRPKLTIPIYHRPYPSRFLSGDH